MYLMAAILTAAVSSLTLAAGRSGGGHGGSRGGSHSGHGGHGHAYGGRVVVGVGFYGGYWPYYRYPYYGYPAYPYYYPAPAYYPPAPEYYEQPQVQPDVPSYWYYCQSPRGYYPQIQSCPGGWTRVPPAPPPG